MVSGLADRGASASFTDALAGADGTADPRSALSLPVVYPDPTLDTVPDAVIDGWAVGGAGALPVPTAGGVIDPAMLARAEAELAQRRAAEQAAAIRADQDRRHAESARRDAAARAAARRAPAPDLPPQVLSFTQWLPPSAQDAVRKSLAQLGAQQSQVSSTAHPPAAGYTPPPVHTSTAARTRPPAPTKPTKKKSSGGGALGVIVFLIVVLFATGLGQRIVEALTQLFNR